MSLSEQMKDRFIAMLEAGRLVNSWERLPQLLEQGELALEEIKELIQLEAENAELRETLKIFADGNDLIYVADLLQTATTDHGIDQTFEQNPYYLSDMLREMANTIGLARKEAT